MKLVISAWWFPVGVPVYLARAARRLGHEVVTVGPTAGATLWQDADPSFAASYEKHAVTPDVPFREDIAPGSFRSIDPELLAEKTADADLWLDVDGGWLYRATFRGERLAKRRVLIVTDPHLPSELDRAREFAACDENGWSPVDAVYLMQYAQCRPEHGEFWMPYAFDPEWHRPFNDVEMDHDVTILGAPYEGRIALAEHLKHHGLRVLGPGRGPVAEDYSRMLCRAPVAVVWPLSDDIPARLYEALACRRRVVMLHKEGSGLMVIPSWPWAGKRSDVFLPRTMDAALEFVRRALEPRPLDVVADFDRSQALAEHTWDARLSSLIAEQCP